CRTVHGANRRGGWQLRADGRRGGCPGHTQHAVVRGSGGRYDRWLMQRRTSEAGPAPEDARPREAYNPPCVSGHAETERAMSAVRLALVVAVFTTFNSVAWAAGEPVTFAKDVAPILQDKCQACHRADSIAPMSLVTYEETRPWARAIKARVVSRQMPPWDFDKTAGIKHFDNARSTRAEQ